MAEIQARTDLTDEQKQEAAQIIQDQLNRAKTGPKVVKDEFQSGPTKGEIEELSNSPAPKRENYTNDEDFARDSKRWAAVQKEVSRGEQETGIDVETVARETLNDPVTQVALTAGLVIPGVNIAAAGALAAGAALDLRQQAREGQFGGTDEEGNPIETDWLRTGLNVLSFVPGAGIVKAGAKGGLGAMAKSGTGLLRGGAGAAAKTAAKEGAEATATTAAKEGAEAAAKTTGTAGKVAGVADDAARASGAAGKAARASGAAGKVAGAVGKAGKFSGALKTAATLTAVGGIGAATSLLGGGAGGGAGGGGEEDGGEGEGETLRKEKSDEEAKRLRGLSGVNISYV